VNGYIQNFAFQNKSTSVFDREHIRIWKFGKLASTGQTIYLGSVNTDTGIDLEFYRDFLVPLHGVLPNVDKARANFLTLLKTKIPNATFSYEDWGIKKLPKKDSESNGYYYTDGKILVVTLPQPNKEVKKLSK
jgi:hypothetical protein